MDRAGKTYWDAVWRGKPIPRPVDPTDRTLGNYVMLRFHELFVRLFPATCTGLRLLEIGCARSSWLPYFALRHGFDVTGLDYSLGGCAQARLILETAGVEGLVVEADMFAPPEELLGRFDVVVSFGLVEHFEDTATALAAMARFLVPDGLLVTSVPNLGRSLVGLLQKTLNRRVYDVHIPLDRRQLASAHVRANLRLATCRYFMAVNWSVVNLAGWRSELWRDRLSRLLARVSKVTWLLEMRGLRLPPNRLTSPYIVAVARGRPNSRL